MDFKTNSEKLIKAFDHMVEQVNQSIHEAEEAVGPGLEKMIHNAQAVARDLYALTQEESDSLAKALKRDLHKANKTLNQQGKELKDWLSFDLTLVEDRFIDLVAKAADKTWLDFHAFEYEDHQASVYHTGEICSAGTLRCNNCGKHIHFSKSSHIPPCATCHHSEFYRVIS
ncbi:MAG: zinc ribbon-containing protein [Gammaproteobacteria bacterium]|nr:zinc ribbon-containing protein [Gammaproteobacteria bacterium]